MPTSTLLYIILALLISVSIAFFQYFFKVRKKPKIHILLFVLKALSLFFLGLLLINPKIKNKKTKNIKPVLSVLVDNSLSTKYFKDEQKVADYISKIKNNTVLNSKFDVSFFKFGENVTVLDSLSFQDKHTNIYKAIKAINDLQKDKLGVTILLSDGNQTIGNDYEFINSKKKIYPVVLGDTTQYADIRISQLNVNKYSYIKNKFPVEVMLFYDGKEPVTSTFSITKSGKRVFSKKVSFTKENNTQTIITNLTSTKEGLHYYSAEISRIKNEKNTKNNYKGFSVEVIDEQTNVLLLTSVLHPDLGALKKAIESNKQRKVDIKLAHKFKGSLKDYQLVVFYQPNSYFKKSLSDRTSNYLLITGTKTDWNFINKQNIGISKEVINQTENYQANYNDNFLPFLQKDIDFDNFPPLKDKFGTITTNTDVQTLLHQKVLNISTEEPLIATFEKGQRKFAAILGEGLWKWRSANFIKEQSFEQFDEFVSNLVQYLASTKKRKRLEVKAQRLYPANSNIVISALYLDKNYKFDNRASLQITLTNAKTKEQKNIPFSLINTSYQVNIEGLLAGDYSYKVSVAGQNINSYGKFKVEEYQVEEQFTNANSKKLQKLADRTKGKLFYNHQEDVLLQQLIDDKTYFTIQKSEVKEENLINWKWMLFVIVSLLSIEWFVRKYYGKI